MPTVQLGGELIHAPRVDAQNVALGVTLDATPGVWDAFGRLRVSNQRTLHETINEFDADPAFWETVTNGVGATISHDPAEASVLLTPGTASGNYVIRQTRRYIPYQAGKSQLLRMTFTLAPAQAGQVQRVGLFDDQTGLFYQLDANGPAVVLRDAGVDTVVRQANWNTDNLLGDVRRGCPSGIVHDPTKSQILWMDLEWLGVGDPYIGFVVDRALHYVHKFRHANAITGVYMKTARLPLRYEIRNTGTVAQPVSLRQICSEISSEGGTEGRIVEFATANGATLRQVATTPLPVLAIRADLNAPAGGTVTNRRAIFPREVEVFSEDAPVYYRVIWGGTVLGGSWADVDAVYSCAQVNASGTAVSGGVVIQSGYVATTSQARAAASQNIANDWALTINAAGLTGLELAVECVRVGSVSSDVGVVIHWGEN